MFESSYNAKWITYLAHLLHRILIIEEHRLLVINNNNYRNNLENSTRLFGPLAQYLGCDKRADAYGLPLLSMHK